MPYSLSQDKLSVIRSDTGQPVGKPHGSQAEALAHLRALEANVSEAGKAYTGSGAMVALTLSDADSQKLLAALPKGVKPEENLHITLVYMPDGGAVQQEIGALTGWLKNYAAGQRPIKGIVSGMGRFMNCGDTGVHPVYASFDSPQLPQFRQDIFDCVETLGIAGEQTHGFTPHITLAYVPEDAKTPAITFEPFEVTFKSVTLGVGTIYQEFPFTGSTKRNRAVKVGARNSAADHERHNSIYRNALEIIKHTQALGADEVSDTLTDAYTGNNPGANANTTSTAAMNGTLTAGKSILDALNYHPAESAFKDCANCVFFSYSPANGAFCHLYNFAAEPLMLCDSWEGAQQANGPTTGQVREPAKDSANTRVPSPAYGRTIAEDVNDNSGANTNGQTTPPAATVGGAGKAQQTFGGKPREDLRESQFLFGDEQAFPIVTRADVSDAVASWGRYKGKHSFEEFKKRLTEKARALGFASALPDTWKDKGSSKSFAVKMLGDARVGGYAIKFGDENHPDFSDYRDFFTPETDFWLDKWNERPMIYQHGLIDGDIERAIKSYNAAATQEQRDLFGELIDDLTALKANPVIGIWDTAKMDALGVWLEGELDKNRKYKEYIARMIGAEALSQSTDTADHLLIREPAANRTHKVVRWPIIASSLTPTPAEPRLTALPVEAIKSAYKAIGLELPPYLLTELAKGAGDAQSAKTVDLNRARIAVATAELNHLLTQENSQ